MQKLQKVQATSRYVLAFLGLLLLAAAGSEARAEVGLVEACLAPDSAGLRSGECPLGQRAWVRPASGLNILSCGSVSVGAECTWGHPELRYRPWDDIRAEALVQTCEADVPIGSFGSVDPCGSGGHDSGKPRIPKASVILPPAGPIINGQGTATLTWIAPTTRTDGTPITAEDPLVGYTLYWGPQSRVGRNCQAPVGPTDSTCYPNRVQIDDAGATTSAFTFELDQSTTLYFALAARTAEEISAYSNEAAKVFTLELEELPPPPPGAPELLEVGISMTCTTDQPRVTCTFTVGDEE